VIVEKPFTPTSQEAEELIALAKKENRLLSVYQNRRWDSDFLTLIATGRKHQKATGSWSNRLEL
jgi:predicted dehydrogenase